MKDGTIVQSKKIAYAMHGGVIMDKKEGFTMVKEQDERLEVVRDGARELC